jgi:hypothetical protein
VEIAHLLEEYYEVKKFMALRDILIALKKSRAVVPYLRKFAQQERET